MWRIYGMKDCVLTWGGLITRPEDNLHSDMQLSDEKSAEVIVPIKKKLGRTEH
jgi:hypothetical protein